MAKETKSNKDVKNKKHFWKDFKAELKKVIWPSPKQLSNKTFAVIVIVLITAAIVFVLDLAFDLLNEKGINKLKANLRDKVVVENVVDNVNETVENTIEVDEVENSVENAE
ncbi:MAG: preprotein translocase subunit SecE [Clostridia bacterium]|nr:preprotein translocase subunit SecE [Clostridia bacterium]